MNAQEWLAATTDDGTADLAVLGAPISRASISPSDAWSTPPAFREALARFPTWDAEHRLDLSLLSVTDLGDVPGDHDDASPLSAHGRIQAAVTEAAARHATVAIIGGDNSLTRPAMHGAMAAAPHEVWGLITLDAHHDVRPVTDGPRNGTPVRELIEAGLPAAHVVQLGIHPFGNAKESTEWAAEQGIHRFTVSTLRKRGAAAIAEEALGLLRDDGVTAIYVDIDIDVVDRAYAPACPASLPGGLTPDELFDALHRLGGDPRLRAFDICEVDARADVNGMTLRLAAHALLSVAAGIRERARD